MYRGVIGKAGKMGFIFLNQCFEIRAGGCGQIYNLTIN